MFPGYGLSERVNDQPMPPEIIRFHVFGSIVNNRIFSDLCGLINLGNLTDYEKMAR